MCDTYCTNHGCNQGHDCPARTKPIRRTDPGIEGARQIEQALCTVYADGRRKGHREMMQAVTAAINETTKKL